ncbi:iron chaperone [Nonomuraea wenchangensis]|uniref:iron chaperone n=1 Tax=Nonomuraea wenchangensis TaxID=568860 RepID=UPI0037235058
MSAAKNTKATAFEGFSEEERAAMKDHAQELKKAARRGSKQVDLEPDVLAKIAEMEGPDRELAERIHAIVKANAPELTPRLLYGMPAYAKDGKVLCFFQPALKFKSRYATLGFNDVANLDDGTMWPAAYALTDLGPDEEARIAALMKKAVSGEA